MSATARDRLILPLDTGEHKKSMELARRLAPWVGTFKFTPDAVISQGAALISEIKALERKVFLDMKLYDIPETVRRACRVAAGLGVDMITIHAGGGARMMEAARTGAREGAGRNDTERMKLIGVTVLTSFEQSELEEYWSMRESIEDRVLAWAGLARAAGLDGVVCSPLELRAIRERLGKDLITVVPGIRGPGDAVSDQRRTLSAGEAIAGGADYLVVGRPIILNPDPCAAAKSILDQIEKAQG